MQIRSLLTPALIAAAGLAGTASMSHAVTIYGTTPTNTLISFDSATPGTVSSGVAISGLANNETLRGIDFRVADSKIYALGSFGNIYTLNTGTGAATLVSTVATTLNGSDFGVDFNPVPNALRITSNTGQNLRITGAGLNTTNIDTNLTVGVSHSAYTNNFVGATTTTLYDINTSNDTLVIQSPPNDGTLVPVGGLGIDVGSVGGFDIYSPNTTTNIAYAALTPIGGSVTNLYTINLTTGVATPAGQIDGGTFITGLTVVPEPTSLGLLGLGAAALLRRKR